MKSILLIDDDPQMHDLTGIILKKAGYTLISALNGSEGLEKILLHKPDLVLLDYMMPEMDGEEVFRRFLTDERYKGARDIPFIMLTAKKQDPSKKAQLLEMGLSAYLNKPFGHRELIDVIESILVTNYIKVRDRQLREAIKNSKDFLENLIDSSPDAIITTDRKGTITFCSKAGEDIFGYKCQEMIGKAVCDYYPEGKKEARRIMRLLTRQGAVKNYETVFWTKDRKRIPVSISLSLIKNAEGEVIGVLGIVKDISELKRLQEELIRSERLAALMETAIAVNHEINNPLAPILGNAQLILREAEHLDEQTLRRVRVIEKNALRIFEITQKLRSITEPVTKEYLGKTRMLDIERSK